MNKICSKCNKELPLTGYYFHKSKRTKDGWNTMCKQCSGSKYGNPRRYWTDKEDEILKKYFPTISNQELVNKFFTYRNVGQVASRARKLNLYKDEKYLYNMQVEESPRTLVTSVMS